MTKWKFKAGVQIVNAKGQVVARTEMCDSDIGRWEIRRRSIRGDFVNLGTTFTAREVDQIWDACKKMKSIPTWEGFWKKYAR